MNTTLILDMNYQPHRVVSWQRAVHMIFDDKVEVLEEYEDVLNSPSFQMQKPSVVRLLKKVKAKKNAGKFSRINLAVRDDFTCQYCGVKLPLHKLNYDHVVPKSKGGPTTWENIVMACYPCNTKKRDLAPEQVGMKLLKRPKEPKFLPVVSVRLNVRNSLPEAWGKWLSR